MEPVQAPGPAPAAPAKAAGPSVAPVLPADAPGTGAVPVPGVAVSAPAPPEEDAVPASSDMVSDAIPDASPGVIPDAVDGANAADAADAAGVLDAVDTADAADMVDVADASVVRAPEPRVESDAGVGEEKVAEPVSEPAPEPVAVREAALFVDPFAGLDDVASLDLYDLSNYTFGKKDVESSGQSMCAVPSAEMSAKLEKRYKERGMRRSVAAVVLVHSHRFPHILLLQRSDGTGKYELPGGRLRPGENDDEGLQRKLKAKLTPIAAAPAAAEEDQELEIGERICNWYAIDFSRRLYPYVPAHVSKPKEELHIYTVSLPEKFMFAVPKNLQLVAVPLFELFNNVSTYGDVICSVPALMSRFHVNYC